MVATQVKTGRKTSSCFKFFLKWRARNNDYFPPLFRNVQHYCSRRENKQQIYSRHFSFVTEFPGLTLTHKAINIRIKHLHDICKVGYDRRVRPGYGGPPVSVGVSLYVLSVGEISYKFMDFTFDMYFRQFWTDERLKFDAKEVTHQTYLTCIFHKLDISVPSSSACRWRWLHQTNLGPRHLLCQWKVRPVPRGNTGQPVPQDHWQRGNSQEHKAHCQG